MQSYIIGLASIALVGVLHRVFTRLESLIDKWMEKAFAWVDAKAGVQVSDQVKSSISSIVHGVVSVGEQVFATKDFWTMALQRARHGQADTIVDEALARLEAAPTVQAWKEALPPEAKELIDVIRENHVVESVQAHANLTVAAAPADPVAKEVQAIASNPDQIRPAVRAAVAAQKLTNALPNGRSAETQALVEQLRAKAVEAK